jgi:phage FluMu protein Com
MASISCPKCAVVLKIAGQLVAGKKVKCPKCAAIFVAADPEKTDEATGVTSRPDRLTPPAVPTGRPLRHEDAAGEAWPRNRKSRAELEDDAEDERPRRKGARKPASNAGLIIGLCVGGGVVVVVLAVMVGGLFWLLAASPPTH